MPPTPDLKSVLAKLRERYVVTSGNTLAAFTALAEQLEAAPAAPELIEALRRELHRIHGTAGSYGFHEASRLAGSLELVAMQWSRDASDLKRRGGIVRQFTRALAAALQAPPDGAGPVLTQRLVLVGLPDAVAAALIPEAVHRGYFVERTTPQGLDEIMKGSPPRAVIASADVPMTLPDDVPLVLLHDGKTGVAPRDARARLIDATADPHEVLLIAESLSAHTRLAGATLLVIDDDPAMIELVRTLGEGEQLFVHSRGDASDIEGVLDEVRPALVLMDIELGAENAIPIVARLRRIARFAELPIVLISRDSSVATRERAFAAGADDFQAKPIVAEELMRRLERLLEVRRQRQVASGVHPATGLLLPERAARAFDDAIVAAHEAGSPLSLAFARPLEAPDGLQRSALWHRECALLGAALALEGAAGGFLDETTLLLIAPMEAGQLAARLDDFAEAAQGEPYAWCAGIIDRRDAAQPSLQAFKRAAEEAWIFARGSVREGKGRIHRWNPHDIAIAPDVVVVEDDVALADLMTFAVAARGFTHQHFATGPGALDGLREMRVHGRTPLVLLDVDLPGLDGFSLFERLRVERPGVFRVAFLSSRASESDQLRALRAGALDYLTKPVSLRVLLAKITLWLQGSPSA